MRFGERKEDVMNVIYFVEYFRNGWMGWRFDVYGSMELEGI